MEKETKQKIKKSEFQALIEKSDTQERMHFFMELGKAFLLPVTLAAISIIATLSINKQQEKNAEHLALQQIKSAHIIAEANREHSARLSKSNQRIERIKHIKDIFQDIITKDCKNSNAMIMQIRSLEIYKGDSLSFLLNIKEHFNNQLCVGGPTNVSQKNKKLKALVTQTDLSILNILKNSQIDVAGRIFVDTKKEDFDGFQTEARDIVKTINDRKIDEDWYQTLIDTTNTSNMRKQTYDNYNFSDCIFINTNLYQANFSSCTLINAIFMEVDLQEASFSESDLSNAIFINCNLKRINFMKSKLRNTLFYKPILNRGDPGKKFISKQGLYCELEDAKFSLGALLWTKSPPFDFVKKPGGSEEENEGYHLYVNLLTPHLQRIEEMEAAKDKKWKSVLKTIDLDYSRLHMDILKEQKRLEKHVDKTLEKEASMASAISENGI